MIFILKHSAVDKKNFTAKIVSFEKYFQLMKENLKSYKHQSTL